MSILLNLCKHGLMSSIIIQSKKKQIGSQKRGYNYYPQPLLLSLSDSLLALILTFNTPTQLA